MRGSKEELQLNLMNGERYGFGMSEAHHMGGVNRRMVKCESVGREKLGKYECRKVIAGKRYMPGVNGNEDGDFFMDRYLERICFRFLCMMLLSTYSMSYLHHSFYVV